MSAILSFGESRPGYDVPVLNEREARAAAGILLLMLVIAAINAALLENFLPMRLVVTLFFVDFALRVLVNPRFAPSLVLARLIVGNQEPEFTGAPQKRFAWSLGLGLAAAVMVMIWGFNIAGPWLMAACMVCMALLYLEAVFGICVGCKLYPLVMRRAVSHCPGGVCAIKPRRDPMTRARKAEIAVLLAVLLGIAALIPVVATMEPPARPGAASLTATTPVPVSVIAPGPGE